MSNKVKTTKMNQGKQELVPKLRFPEFNDDGEWKIKKIGDKNFASLHKGKGISKSDIDLNGKIPCIRYGELYTRYNEVIDVVFSKTNCPVSNLFLSKKNDVIIPSSGETKIDIAKASCVTLENVSLGGDLNVIRSKDNGIFISYYLNGPKKREIAKIAQGDSVVHLYLSQLEKLELLIPKPPEQQKIADCLSSIDDLITAESEKLEFIKNHKKGLMQNLFPSDGNTTPNFRFPEFKGDGEWEVKPLGKICKYSNGGGNENNVVDNGKYYLISLNSIDIEGNLKPNMKRVNHIDNSLIKNDLVMVLSDVAYGNFLGLSAIIPNNNYVLNQRMAGLRVRSNQNINIEYLRLFVNNNQKYFKQKGQGSSQQNLSKPSVEKFPILLPNNPKEQQKIADCLSSIDDLITSQTQKIEALKTHKKGLMQQIFPNIDQNHKSK